MQNRKKVIRDISITVGVCLLFIVLFAWAMSLARDTGEAIRQPAKEKCIENGHDWVENVCIPGRFK